MLQSNRVPPKTPDQEPSLPPAPKGTENAALLLHCAANDFDPALVLPLIKGLADFQHSFRARFKDEKKEKELKLLTADAIIALVRDDKKELAKVFKEYAKFLTDFKKDDLKDGFKAGEEKLIKRYIDAFEQFAKKKADL